MQRNGYNNTNNFLQAMSSQLHILMTGAGAPGAAGIIKCLREVPGVKIFAADRSKEAYGRLLCDQFTTLPDALSPNFVDETLAFCKANEIQILLPLVTRELLPLSIAKQRFSDNGITVLVSDMEELSIANDKGMLYQALSDKGIAHPSFFRVNSWFQMHKAIQDLGYPHVPVVIKPCVSNGLRGFRVVQAAINEHDLLLNHKPDNHFITLRKLEEIFANNTMPDFVVSEFLPGKEYTVDVLAQKGKVLQVIPRERVAMSSGISTKGVIENHREIIDYVTQIVSALKLDWIVGVQVKEDVNGHYKIVEINPRIQGTTVACLGAGINFPALAIELVRNKQFTYKEPEWGVKFVRHWQEVFYK